MRKYKYLKLVIGIALVWICLTGNSIEARGEPNMYISGPKEILGIGAEFAVKIFIETENPLNAYEGIVKFDPSLLEVLVTSDASSIIDVMRDQPTIFEDGRVAFSGASLKPFSGAEGLLLTINFRVLKEGINEVKLQDAFVYLANGKGTKIRLNEVSLNFEFQKGVAVQKEATIVDEAPPTVLNLSLTEDPINENQKLLGFVVKDNSAGVKQTYVQYMRWLTWSDEKIAENPTALPKNAWAVKFKAMDNTGNIIEKIIYDWEAFVYYDLLILVLGSVAFGIVINRIRRRKRV